MADRRPGYQPGGPSYGPGLGAPGPTLRDWPGGRGPDAGLPLQAGFESFTLDAYLAGTISSSFTLDAIIKREQTASLTLDAVVAAFNPTFTLNAVLFRAQAATFTLDAVLADNAPGFTLNAVVRKVTLNLFTLGASFRGPFFTLDALLFKNLSASFTLNAVVTLRGFSLNAAITIITPQPGTTPGGSPIPVPGTVEPGHSIINVFIGNAVGGGLTDFAEHMVYSKSRFESQVNGSPGTATFYLKDLAGTMTVLPGQDVTLVINGQVVWRGFISNIKRTYMFPAINVGMWGSKRMYKIEAVDQNVLFRRRFVFNQSTPEDVAGTEFPLHTADTTALADLFENFIDLGGDDIDVTTFVDNVADINFDLKARILSAGMTWGDTMRAVASMPGAIFYLLPNLGSNPRAYLVYTDVDTPTAPFALSDVPDGITSRGYQQVEILADGSQLANDVMAWGFGYGNASPVFTRLTDAASLAQHGRWQRGERKYGIWKQGSIERVADSIVYGSPLNKRGSKDDRPAVEITVFDPGLLPSQKVDFHSEVFDYHDVIPIRKMIVTFEAPAVPKYQLTLSHEIDLPNSPIDPMPFNFPPFPDLPPFPPFPPLPGPPPSGGGGTTTETIEIAASTFSVVLNYDDMSYSGIEEGPSDNPELGWLYAADTDTWREFRGFAYWPSAPSWTTQAHVTAYMFVPFNQGDTLITSWILEQVVPPEDILDELSWWNADVVQLVGYGSDINQNYFTNPIHGVLVDEIVNYDGGPFALRARFTSSQAAYHDGMTGYFNVDVVSSDPPFNAFNTFTWQTLDSNFAVVPWEFTGNHSSGNFTTPGWIREFLDADLSGEIILAEIPVPGSIHAYVGGFFQTPADYVLDAPNKSLVFNTPPTLPVDITYYSVGSS